MYCLKKEHFLKTEARQKSDAHSKTEKETLKETRKYEAKENKNKENKNNSSRTPLFPDTHTAFDGRLRAEVTAEVTADCGQRTANNNGHGFLVTLLDARVPSLRGYHTNLL